MNTPSHFQAVYLDHNATTPVCDAARQAALAVMSDCFGNPSSTHSEGLVARQVLDQARAAARAALRVPQGELIFGSGATEALHTAVFSALLHCHNKYPTLVNPAQKQPEALCLWCPRKRWHGCPKESRL